VAAALNVNAATGRANETPIVLLGECRKSDVIPRATVATANGAHLKWLRLIICSVRLANLDREAAKMLIADVHAEPDNRHDVSFARFKRGVIL
jgi:hypothetical protein